MENTRAVVRRRFGPGERAALVAEYRKGGLTQFAFAREAGISVSCLHNPRPCRNGNQGVSDWSRCLVLG